MKLSFHLGGEGLRRVMPRLRRSSLIAVTALAIGGLALSACSQAAPPVIPTRTPVPGPFERVVRAPSNPAPSEHPQNQTTEAASIKLTLETAIGDHNLGFKGIGGDIDGKFNPPLMVPEGAVVEVTLKNGDGAIHDFAVPDLGVKSPQVETKGSSHIVKFKASKSGQFTYLCTIPGHKQAGMEGMMAVGDVAGSALSAPSIARAATDLPGPVGNRPPKAVQVDLTAEEKVGKLADGASYNYWTFNGQVPGPFVRVRVGDTVTVSLTNKAESSASHSVDLHAATGPGGGGTLTQVAPGQTKSFTFKALNPGVYVYHCATPMVAHHISSGMYGLILVEPEGGLPKVDREFYVMQGEIYTKQALGTKGQLDFAVDKLMNEQPEYFVLNGAVGALASEHPLKAKVGETVRIYFGVGGPNFTSSFHVIGEIFDRVYDQGALTSEPLKDVQTTIVPTGGATMVEFKLDVPGKYILVDHSLSRLERGLAGVLEVEGAEQPSIYRKEGA